MNEQAYAILNRPRRHRFVTMRQLLRQAFGTSSKPLALSAIFECVEGHTRLQNLRCWKSRVRQALHCHNDFKQVGKGLWRLKTGEEIRSARYA